MNTNVGKVIGEASALSGPGGLAHYPPPPHPSEQPASPVHAAMGTAPEERTEKHIGEEILQAVSLMLPLARRDKAVARIEQLAQELVQMHAQAT